MRGSARDPMHRFRGQLIALALVAAGATGAVAAWAASSGRPPATLGPAATTTAPPISSPACRSNPQEGVHDPKRLTVLSPCVQAVGTVARIPELPADGDATFDLRLDDGYGYLMNAKNRSRGTIHVEIVPMDQPGCTAGRTITKPSGYDNLGVCSGAHVAMPPLGAHVRVTGPWVTDRWVGWNEIHPAWQVEVLPPGAHVPPPTTAPTTTASAPARLLLAAHLTGRATVGAKGARHGAANAVLTITPAGVCWRFSDLHGLARPTHASVARADAKHAGRRLLALGRRYSVRGCKAADPDRVLEPLAESPGHYYVTLTTRAHPKGAVRGRLHVSG